MKRFLWLLCGICACGVCFANFELTILHNNDMHSRFEETARESGRCMSKFCYGGFGRLSKLLKKERQENPNVIYLNAGDNYGGTAWYNMYGGKLVAEMMNILKPEAISLGTKEFEAGVDGLMPFLNNLNFPVIACNLDTSKEPSFKYALKKSVVLTVGGTKVGIIGYLTTETIKVGNTSKIQFFAEIAEIKKEAELLNNQQVYILIALGHSGLEIDKAIAQENTLIDVVIGGRSNTFLYNGNQPNSEHVEGPYPTRVKNVAGNIIPVATTYGYTKYLGKLIVTFDGSGKVLKVSGQPILMSYNYTQDEEVLSLLNSRRAGLKEYKKRVIGQAMIPFLKEPCLSAECVLGNIVTDALVAQRMINFGLETGWTDASIALINSGSLKGNIPKGKITVEMLSKILPYEMNIYSMDIKGSDLLTILKHSHGGRAITQSGQYLQTSGIKIIYGTPPHNDTKPSLEVLVRCAKCTAPQYMPINLSEKYRILINSFMKEGGFGYSHFEKRCTAIRTEDLSDLDTLAWYVEKEDFLISEIAGRVKFSRTTNLKPFRVRYVLYLILFSL